jgi:hypothetical protein
MLNGTASHIYGSDQYTLNTDNRRQAGSVMSDKRIGSVVELVGI